MPIYTNHPCDDGFLPMMHPLLSSIGIGPKVTKIIDAATKDWLDKHPEATTTVVNGSLEEKKLKPSFSLELCRCFDTVADMQAATDLKAGMTCHTNGFHSAGDGGAAFYQVTTDGEPNGMDVLALRNDLIADFIVTESYVTPEQFGAWGDGEHDDTLSIQSAIDKSNLMLSKEYLVTTSARPNCIAVPSNRFINFVGAEVKLSSNSLEGYSIFNISGADNVNLYGSGFIVGDKDNHSGSSGEWGFCVNIVNSKNVSISGIDISKAWGDGIYIGSGSIENSESVDISNCIIHDNRRNNISITACINVHVSDCTIYNAGGAAPYCGIDIEPNDNGVDYVDNIHIHECNIYDNYGQCIYVLLYNNIPDIIQHVYIDNCICKGNTYLVAISHRVDTNIMYVESNVTAILDGNTACYNIGDKPDDVIYADVKFLELDITNAAVLFGSNVYNVDINVSAPIDVQRWYVNYQPNEYSNNSLKIKCNSQIKETDTSPDTKSIDYYSSEYSGYTVFTSPGYYISSHGGYYELAYTDSTHTVPVRESKMNVGTRIVIRNKTGYTQNVQCTPVHYLQDNHMGIYECFEHGVLTLVNDISLSS